MATTSNENFMQYRRLAWIVWGVSSVFALFQFFLQLSSGAMVNGLMREFNLTALGGGVLASTYYYVYVTLQTPAGLLIDRFGPRRLLSGGAIVCGLGACVFGMSHHVLMAGFGRLLMGGGASFAFVGSLALIGRWFPPERFTMMTAIAETIGMLGSILGSSSLAALIQNVGWRGSMIGAGFFALCLSILLWTIVRDNPPNGQTHLTSNSPSSFKQLLSDLVVLVKNKYAWINGLYSGLTFAVVTVFVALWGIPYLMLAHHISLLMATFICNLVFLGVAIGGPVVGWLDYRFHHRRTILILWACASSSLLMILLQIPTGSLALTMVLMVLLGFFSSGYVLTFGVANEIVPSHLRSTSIGFVNSLSVGTAPILQPIVGLFLNMAAAAAARHGVMVYTVRDYQLALLFIPFLVLVAAVLGFFIPPARR